MIRGLLGRKIGMSQIFDNEGNVIPVTVIEAGPCYVLALREAPFKVKLGFSSVRESRTRKSEAGLYKKLGLQPLKLVKEFESTDNKDYKLGQELRADVFKPGDFVDVTGISKGKGFQGGMKRWNWSGGGATHGSMHHRRIGSAGSSAWPSRTFKGHHMPGHMGQRVVTIQGLRVIQVSADENLVLVRGAVPGEKNAFVSINRSKKRAFQPLGEKKVTEEKKRNPMKQSKAKAKGGK